MVYRSKKTVRKCSDCSLFSICPISENDDDNSDIVKKGITVNGGEDIAKIGQPLTKFAIVRTGLFKSWDVNQDGKAYISSFFMPGDLIGIESIYHGQHTSAITALTDSEICAISIDEFRNRIHTNKLICKRSFWLISRNISFRQYLLLVDTEKRLAGFLYEIIVRLQLIKNNIVELPIKQIEIANHLNLSPETINRTLRRLEEKGVISDMRNKQFVIDDIKLLKDISLK